MSLHFGPLHKLLSTPGGLRLHYAQTMRRAVLMPLQAYQSWHIGVKRQPLLYGWAHRPVAEEQAHLITSVPGHAAHINKALQ